MKITAVRLIKGIDTIIEKNIVLKVNENGDIEIIKKAVS